MGDVSVNIGVPEPIVLFPILLYSEKSKVSNFGIGWFGFSLAGAPARGVYAHHAGIATFQTPCVNAKEKARARRLWDNYKLTLEDYDKILAFQGGVCWACHRPEPVKGRRLSVDHDHATGLVRGLLCSRCNPVLGKIERAFVRYGLGKVLGLAYSEWIRRIAMYALHHPATAALGHPHYGYKGHVGTKAHRKRIRQEKRKLPPPTPPLPPL